MTLTLIRYHGLYTLCMFPILWSGGIHINEIWLYFELPQQTFPHSHLVIMTYFTSRLALSTSKSLHWLALRLTCLNCYPLLQSLDCVVRYATLTDVCFFAFESEFWRGFTDSLTSYGKLFWILPLCGPCSDLVSAWMSSPGKRPTTCWMDPCGPCSHTPVLGGKL